MNKVYLVSVLDDTQASNTMRQATKSTTHQPSQATPHQGMPQTAHQATA